MGTAAVCDGNRRYTSPFIIAMGFELNINHIPIFPSKMFSVVDTYKKVYLCLRLTMCVSVYVDLSWEL